MKQRSIIPHATEDWKDWVMSLGRLNTHLKVPLIACPTFEDWATQFAMLNRTTINLPRTIPEYSSYVVLLQTLNR